MTRGVDSHNREGIHVPLIFKQPCERLAHVAISYECAGHNVPPYELGICDASLLRHSRRLRFLNKAVVISKRIAVRP
jgi:hypothetical protein